MKIELDYKTFCNTYYKAAKRVADITIAGHIKKHGQLNPFIDVGLVKDLGISYGLEKVYNTYDIDHESKANVETFLSTVVRNCVLTELGKESTAVGAKRRPGKAMDDSMTVVANIGGDHVSLESFSGTFRTSGRFMEKEDLIATMLKCLKKLNGVDQVILGCWMLYPKREYTDKAIEDLGWADSARTRNVVNVRCNRAITTLGKMMDDSRSIYLDIIPCYKQHISERTSDRKAKSNNDYNFIRRRQRAAKKSITSGIDYHNLAKSLSTNLSDYV